MHHFTFHSDLTLIGSTCSGNYGDRVSLDSLKDFHRRRVQVLAASGADLIAFETIPNKLEAKAYAELLEEEGVEIPAWFSFSCKDGANVVSGDPIEECAAIADSCEQVFGVGINCTAPRFVHQLIQSIQKVYILHIYITPKLNSHDINCRQQIKLFSYIPTLVRLMMQIQRNGW